MWLLQRAIPQTYCPCLESSFFVTICESLKCYFSPPLNSLSRYIIGLPPFRSNPFSCAWSGSLIHTSNLKFFLLNHTDLDAAKVLGAGQDIFSMVSAKAGKHLLAVYTQVEKTKSGGRRYWLPMRTHARARVHACAHTHTQMCHFWTFPYLDY